MVPASPKGREEMSIEHISAVSRRFEEAFAAGDAAGTDSRLFATVPEAN